MHIVFGGYFDHKNMNAHSSNAAARCRLAFLACAAALVSNLDGFQLHAANKTWDGGGENNLWTSAANWDANTAPAPGDSLFFTQTTRLLNTNNFPGGTPFNGITFSPPAGAFELRGNSIALGGGITNHQVVVTETVGLPLALSVAPTVSVADSASLTLGGAISGAGLGLTKVGGGLLTLAGANTFEGPLSINAGTVSVAADNHLGAAPGAATPGNIVIDNSKLRATSGFAINANRGIALGPTSGSGSGTFEVQVGVNVSYGGVLANNGGVGGLSKLSFGGLTLSGANTYTGPTAVKNGTLTLDFTQGASPVNNVINPVSALTLGGATAGVGTTNFAALILNGQAATVNSQTFNDTVIDLGAAQVRANSGAGGTANLALGALSHNLGGVVNFIPPSLIGGTGNISTTATNVNGIIGGWALVSDGTVSLQGGTAGNPIPPAVGTNLARVDASGNIVPYTDYTVYANADGNVGNVMFGTNNLLIGSDVTGDSLRVDMDRAPGAGITYDVNTITFNRSINNWSLNVGSNNVLRLGKTGALFSQYRAGSPTWGITSVPGGVNNLGQQGHQDTGTLTAGGPNNNSSGEIIVHLSQAGSGSANNMVIDAKVTDNGTGPVTVVKAGPGFFKLRGHNTYSGGTYVLQGRVQLSGSEVGTSNPDGLGTGPLYIFPGAYLFFAGTGSPITNAMFIAGNAARQEEGIGAIRTSGGWQVQGLVTLIGDATIGGNGNVSGGIAGKITGPFNLNLCSAGTVNGTISISNPNNDWTGTTTIQARNNTGNNNFISGGSEIIPHGFGKGNVVMQGYSVGTINWNLNGFNETVNGLSTAGTGPSCIIINNGATPSTLTVGDNDQSGTFGGSIQDGAAPVGLTKIGGGSLTLSGGNSYSGNTAINGGTLALSGVGSIASQEILVNNGSVLNVAGISDFNASTLRLASGTFIADAANVNLTALAITNGALTLVPDTADINITTTTLTTGGATNRVNITTVSGVASYPAVFTLVKYTGAIGGAGNNFGIGEVPSANTVGYVSNDVANARLVLVLLDGPKPLTWTGMAGWDWDLDLTTNWLAFKGTPNEVPATFSQADSTIFDDTGLTNNINVTGLLSPGGITVNNTAANYTFVGSGTLAGLGGLVKNGAGNLTLANPGPNEFRGGINANGGTVILATDNAIAGGASIASGATVQVGTNGPTGNLPAGSVQNDGSILFNRTNNFTVANVISGNGTLTKNNAGVLTLSGANTAFTGAATVSQGTLRAGSGAALGTTDGTTTVNSGATLDVNGQVLNTEPVIVSGAGVTNGGAIVNTGADQINAMGNVTLAGHTTFGGTGRWDIRGGAATLSTGGNAYNLTKVGNNQFSLVGVNIDATPGTSLADIVVSNGLFSVETTTTSLGDSASTLTVYTNGTVQFFNTTAPWSKQFVLHGGTVTKFNNPSGANTVAGPVTLNLACIFNVGGTSLTLDGAIGGSGGLTKIGAATLTLNGAGTYTGNTTVNAGTLILNNLLNGGGSLSNAVGTTLAGNGTNNGAVFVNGTLVPGGANVAGSFGADALTMTNAQITFDIGAGTPANDLIFADGNLTLLGTNTITLVAGPVGGVTAGQVITLIQYTGTLTGGTNNLRLVVPQGYGFTLLDPTTTPGFIQLSVLKAPLNIVWRGVLGTAWDIETTLNWVNAADNVTPADYSDFDGVTFGDTANTNVAALAASIQPASIAMNNSTVHYTFIGPGRITGTTGLKVQGGGSLTIANSGTNNFSGAVEINAGTLQVGNGGPDGNLGTGPITNSSGLVFNRSGNLTVTPGIHGSGPLTNKGPGVVILSGASTYEGDVMIEQGTLRAGSGTALGNPLALGATTIANGATLDVGGQALNNEAVTVGGAGVGGLGAIINSGADSLNAMGNVVLTSDTTFGGTGRWDIRGGLASLSTAGNSFSVTKVGPNQVSLVGVGVDAALSNIFVQGGVFSVETTTATLGNPLGTVAVSAGATLQFFNTTAPWDKVFVLNGDGIASTVNVANGIGNNILSGITLNGGCIFNTAGGTALSLAGALSGGGSLITSGAGALTLNGANSYTGDTTINGGALILVGAAALPATSTVITVGAGATLDVTALTGGPTLTLASGQTLQGNGSINGSVVAPVGSTVSPGLSVGVLTVTNNVTLGGTTIMELDGVAGTNDAIRSVTGSITYGGTLNLVSLSPLPGGSSYKLFYAASYSGSFTLNPATPGPGQTWDTSTLNTDGTLRVVGNPPAATRPVIVSTVRFGSDLVISGTNGTASGEYYVLLGTNIVQPIATWTPIATNSFVNGTFSFTNTVDLNVSQRFYLLQVP
jgi:autotransporter-associated beta strand protein